MHKALRLKVRKAKSIERKIQALAFEPGARRERAKMIENRHWYDRDPKGELLTGNDREVKGHTLRASDVVAGVRSI